MEPGARVAPDNPYAAPQARIAEAPATAERSLYVVAPRKFLLLSIVTFTWYHVYWFYRQWAELNRRDRDYWPVMRAIFSIFFAHSLFERVDERLREQGVRWYWSGALLATAYVVAVVGSRVLDAVARSGVDPGWALWLPLALGIVEVLALYRAQLAVNAAERDPDGTGNATLTPANYAWLSVFGLLWLVVLFAIYVMVDPTVIDLGE
jgi:hypothetical protein